MEDLIIKIFHLLDMLQLDSSLKLKYTLDRFDLSTELADHFAIFYAKGNDNKKY